MIQCMTEGAAEYQLCDAHVVEGLAKSNGQNSGRLNKFQGNFIPRQT